ncbi:MAG: glycosyltransferase family 9 protein [Verrucomicrobiae bacterium]
MHSIEFEEKKTFGEVSFDTGVRYLVEDHNAAQFMIQGGARVEWRNALGFSPDIDWNWKKILVVRCGALGDLLMLTPTFREIKRRWPKCNLTVATFPRYRSVLVNNPHVDAFLDYPVIEDLMDDYQGIVWLENAVETHPDARKMTVIDALARRFGIEKLPDRSTVYAMFDGERMAAEDAYPRTSKRRVGIQTRASAHYKSYGQAEMDQAAMLLYKHGWEVFLFGNPGEINAPDMPGLVNVTKVAKTVRESAAIAATCDVILSPDSFFVHLAAALGLPCVALYGPFPANLYTAHYPKCRAIQGRGKCSPCFHHPRGTHFPTSGPCWKTGRCEVLADITPRAIVRAVEEAK